MSRDCCKQKVITKQGMPGILGKFCLKQDPINGWAAPAAQVQIINGLSQQLEEGEYLVLFDAQLQGETTWSLVYYLTLDAVEIPLTRKTEAETITASPHHDDIGFNECITVPVGGGLLEVVGDGVTDATLDMEKANLIILKLS